MMKPLVSVPIALLLSFAGTVATAETVALVGGTLFPSTDLGAIENATVLIQDGRVSAVGQDIPTPSDARVLDVRGRIITAGLILPYSQVGLVEVRFVDSTEDYTAPTSPFSASLDMAYSLNRHSLLIPVTRGGGITRAVAAPEVRIITASLRNSIFAGRGVLIHLDGADPDIVTRRHAGLYVSLGEQGARLAGGSRSAAWQFLRMALDDAEALRRGRVDLIRLQRFVLPPIDTEALIGILEGKVRLVVHINRRADIEELIRFSDEMGIAPVLLEAREAWMVASELAAIGAAVILNPKDNVPNDFDSLGSSFENAAVLQGAGVEVAIAPMGITDYENGRTLRHMAGIAVAHGMPWNEALNAITINPARIFGVADKLGSVEVGKLADIVIWDGDPFEFGTTPLHIFINGREVPIRTHQDDLAERYLDLDRAHPPFQYR